MATASLHRHDMTFCILHLASCSLHLASCLIWVFIIGTASALSDLELALVGARWNCYSASSTESWT